MKRPRLSRRMRHAPDLDTLIHLATELGKSSSRIEDVFWEPRVNAVIDRLLLAGDDDTLNAGLDQLYQEGNPGYESLADLIECRAESLPTGEVDTLLIAAPILGWSRYSIPSGGISADVLANLRTHLKAYILANDVRLAVADALYSPDQLPAGFSEIARLTLKLGKAALHDRDVHIDPAQLPETTHFLSDTRYLIAAISTPRGAALFRWQEIDGSRDSAQRSWVLQGGEALRPLFPACAIEALPPLAFFAACREADRQSRAYALKASTAFLGTQLNLAPGDLRAVIGAFHDQRLEEYRIGFTRTSTIDVIHGVIWPLLESEDENTDVVSQIEATLKECGIRDVITLDQRFPVEFCDDCGAPLYPNPEGEPVHAEMPEEEPGISAPRHLH